MACFVARAIALSASTITTSGFGQVTESYTISAIGEKRKELNGSKNHHTIVV
jgi:hypothetical protein